MQCIEGFFLKYSTQYESTFMAGLKDTCDSVLRVHHGDVWCEGLHSIQWYRMQGFRWEVPLCTNCSHSITSSLLITIHSELAQNTTLPPVLPLLPSPLSLHPCRSRVLQHTHTHALLFLWDIYIFTFTM